jgi:hypothetical protein
MEAEMKVDKNSFFSFERMITPVIIKILFWIGLIGSAISGIVVFFTMLIGGINRGGAGSILGGFLLGLIAGVVAFALGALVTRIYSEMLILFFRINETLSDIKGILQEKLE